MIDGHVGGEGEGITSLDRDSGGIGAVGTAYIAAEVFRREV